MLSPLVPALGLTSLYTSSSKSPDLSALVRNVILTPAYDMALIGEPVLFPDMPTSITPFRVVLLTVKYILVPPSTEPELPFAYATFTLPAGTVTVMVIVGVTVQVGEKVGEITVCVCVIVGVGGAQSNFITEALFEFPAS